MNILTQYTRRCLRRNRVRTLVTVIGIILSVALFTAVAEGAVSGLQYLVDVAKAEAGAYHAMYDEISQDQLEELRSQEGVEQVVTLDGLGWALAGDASQVYPYLRISAMSEDFCELVSVRLLEGRMPENSRELIISNRAAASTGADLRVGQRLRLRLGQRETLEGQPLGEHNPYLFEEERLTDCTEADYTIVGLYDRLSSDIESYEMPGTLVLTVGASSLDRKAFFTLDRIGDTLDFLQTHDYGSSSVENRDLLLYSGVSSNQLLTRVIYGLAAILFALIFLGSVALIYNSFSISVSQRTQQFGLLKSIGATNRQMRRAVLTEALLLCVVGIPAGLLLGCGGIGLTLRFLRPAFARFIPISGSEGVNIHLVPSLPALALAAGIGLLTALVSAWIPAKRATRLPPISAIRQSRDVKVRAGELRVSGLTRRIFGFPGTLAAKNFKRSRKQYRSTVVSLFMSIVLFISACSFADCLRRDVAENVSSFPADLIIQYEGPEPLEDPETVNRGISAVEGISQELYSAHCSLTLELEAESLTPQALSMLGGQEDPVPWILELFFLPDEVYGQLCAEAGLDPAQGEALLYGRTQGMVYQQNGAAYMSYDLLKQGFVPLEASLKWETSYIPGYYQGETEYSEEGEISAYCFDSYETDETGKPVDRIKLSPAEAEGRSPVTIAACLEEKPLAAGADGCSLYLPLSAAEGLLKGRVRLEQNWFLRAENHSQVRQKLENALSALSLSQDLHVWDTREGEEATQALLLVLNVFTFGFIVLISLIAAANVFNTISTNIALRRREFATLKSVGMGNRAFGRMMRFECLLYGAKALLFGLPVSILMSWLIWKTVNNAFLSSYHLPWTAMGIAAGSVFLVVFATMLYATGKIRRDNPMDALKTETL